MLNCAKLILDFIDQSPATCRDWFAARVHMLILKGGTEMDCDHFAEIRDALLEEDRLANNAVIFAAAIDHALLPFGPEADEYLPKLAQEHDSPIFNEMAAKSYLRTKHIHQMRQNWKELRTTFLSPEAVREFEHNALHHR